MKIKKTSETTPTMASVVNQTNSSTEDSYSCNYANQHYGGTVLYENATGVTGTVTLSDNPLNYNRIDIIYVSGSLSDFGHQVQSMYPGVSPMVTILWYWMESNWGGWIGQHLTANSNGTLTRGDMHYFGGNYQNITSKWQSTSDKISILKVIGYK